MCALRSLNSDFFFFNTQAVRRDSLNSLTVSVGNAHIVPIYTTGVGSKQSVLVDTCVEFDFPSVNAYLTAVTCKSTTLLESVLLKPSTPTFYLVH